MARYMRTSGAAGASDLDRVGSAAASEGGVGPSGNSDESVIVISSDDEDVVLVSSSRGSGSSGRVESLLDSLERRGGQAQHSSSVSDSGSDPGDSAESETRASAHAFHDDDLFLRYGAGPQRATDPGVRRYMSYMHDGPLSTGLIGAAISSQPSLPPAARGALPFLDHREEVDGKPLLRCQELPADLPPGLLTPQTPEESEALLSTPVELGHFHLPLVPWDSSPDAAPPSPAAVPSPLLAELAAVVSESGPGKQLGASRLEVSWLEQQEARTLDAKAFPASDPWASLPDALPNSLERRFWVYLSVCIPATDYESSPLAAALMARRRAPGRGRVGKAPGKNQQIRFMLAKVDADLPRSFMLARLARMKHLRVLTPEFRLTGPGLTIDLGEGRFSRACTAGTSQPLATQAALPPLPRGACLDVPNKANRRKRNGRKGQARAQVQEGETSIQAAVAEGIADPSRWSLRVGVRTCPPAMAQLMATPEELAREADDAAARTSKRKMEDENNMSDLAAVLQDILLMGHGLFVGPDCDGALNFCDHSLMSVLSADESAAMAACSIPVGGSPRRASMTPGSPGKDGEEKDTEAVSARRPLCLPPLAGLPEWLFSLPQLFSGSNLSDDYPAAAVPPAVRSVPKPFQLQGLEWMLRRERQGEAAGRSLLRLFPTWLQFVTEHGVVFYMFTPRGRDCPLLSQSFLAAPTGGTCGGFLCDEMGLGKTLESLMLVLGNPAPAGWALTTQEITTQLSAYSEALQVWKAATGQSGDAAKGRAKRASAKRKGKAASDSLQPAPELNLQHPIPVKTTLVIVPGNLIRQWQQEGERHILEGALTWGEYDEQSALLYYIPHTESGCSASRPESSTAARRARVADIDKQTTIPTCKVGGGDARAPLTDLDIVFLSYERMRKEVANTRSPLLKFGFWRIMLDEAQLVANSNSVAAVNASQLWRRHAWVVTGTPVSSRLDEISGLCEFLALQPFADRTTWETEIGLTHRERQFDGLVAIRGLLKGVMLRRTKEHVGQQLEMPPCSFVDLPIELSQVERLFYQQMEAKVRQGIKKLKADRQAQAQAREAFNKVAKSTARVQGLLTSLRQCCCHPHVVRQAEVTQHKVVNRQSMQQIMSTLVSKAYAEYDSAVGSWLGQRARAAAVDELLVNDREALGDMLRSVLVEVQGHGALVGGTDIRRQGSIRGSDGSMRADTSLEPKQELFPDANAARDRRRRYTRLELDIHVFIGYCIHARWPGALASLTVPAQSNGHEPPAKRLKTSGAPEEEPGAEPSAEMPATQSAGPSDTAADAPPAVPEAVSAGLRQEMATEADLRVRLGLEPISFLDAVASREVRKSRRQAGLEVQEGQESPSKRPPDLSTGMDSEPIVILDTQEEEQGGLEMSDSGSDAEDYSAHNGRAARGRSSARSVKASAKKPRTETDTQVLMRSEGCMRDLLLLLGRGKKNKQAVRDCASKAVANATEEMQKKWHSLQHLLNEEEEQLKAPGQPLQENGSGGNPPGDQAEVGVGIGTEGEEEGPVCPICLDVPKTRTVTSCGHSFCTICAAEIMNTSRKCAICRKLLAKSDLFSEASAEELEEEARQEQLREASAAAAGEFGTKVSTLLSELDAIAAKDPGAKSLVFSTWGRLLSLVGHAFTARGIPYVCLFGNGPEGRRQALTKFAEDPSCRVMLLLMSNSSGAAGLTLTQATHAFLLEPALSPGLEAQAAARIYRLGQTMPTRVVRLIAQNTVEQRVLALQAAKSQARGKAQGRLPGRASTSAGDAAGSAFEEGAHHRPELSGNDIDTGIIMQFFDI